MDAIHTAIEAAGFKYYDKCKCSGPTTYKFGIKGKREIRYIPSKSRVEYRTEFIPDGNRVAIFGVKFRDSSADIQSFLTKISEYESQLVG